MRTALIAFQFIVSIMLIAVVLLQPSKGEGLGAIGGGARMFFYKEKGWEALLSKVTTVVAVLFLVSSILLTIVK